jgi:D-alanine-D-alanine ligase
MAKTRLAVLFGGITVEHEVSVITGLQLIKNVDRTKYDVTPVYIDKAGQWWTGEKLLAISYYGQEDLFAPRGLEPFSLSLNRGANPLDVAILCFHGGYGEAGNVQGALELAGVPYQGPGVMSSALCFDKIALRQVLTAAGINQTQYVWFTKQDWQNNQAHWLEQINQLNYPVFVKPANGGSTVGIERVKSAQDVVAAIDRVSAFDSRILIEAEIKDCIEVNVSVLGIEGNVKTSVPEQPIKADEFLSYADKYERGGKKSGMASATRRIPAPISGRLTEKLQTLAKDIFHLFDCSGVIRIDFFVDPSEETVYVVEPNTIPGSMSFYLWEATGLKYPQLVDELVAIALEKAARQKDITHSFESNILKNKTEI